MDKPEFRARLTTTCYVHQGSTSHLSLWSLTSKTAAETASSKTKDWIHFKSLVRGLDQISKVEGIGRLQVFLARDTKNKKIIFKMNKRVKRKKNSSVSSFFPLSSSPQVANSVTKLICFCLFCSFEAGLTQPGWPGTPHSRG